jgi:hypothetical protein
VRVRRNWWASRSAGRTRELVLRAGEADPQAFDLAELAFAPGLGDTSDQVVADLK